jgi:Retroviral aspartyl protease
MESQAKDEDKTRPVETTLKISSVNEVFSRNPLTFKGTLNHAPVHILIDSGAMGNFVSRQAADRFSFALHHVSDIPIVFANGTTDICNKSALAAYLCFQNHEEHIDLRVVSLPHHDIILGKPWLEKWNPTINWQTHEITFSPDDKPVTQIGLNKRVPSKTQEAPLTTISFQELNQTLTSEDQLYLCTILETGELVTNQNDPRIQPILTEFQDVFPVELPAELPPKRDIDHRIELEPGNCPPW